MPSKIVRHGIPTLMTLQKPVERSNEISVDAREIEDETEDEDEEEEPVSDLFKPIDYNPTSTSPSKKRPRLESHEPSCSHLNKAAPLESPSEWPFPIMPLPTHESGGQLTKVFRPEAIIASESKERIDSSLQALPEPDLTATCFRLLGFKKYSDDDNELQQEVDEKGRKRAVKSEVLGYFDL